MLRFLENKLRILFFIFPLFIALLYTRTTEAQSGLQGIIHGISVEQVPGEVAYKVQVYFSALDNSFAPIKDLTIANLTLKEDGTDVTIDSLEPVGNSAISLVLVMDTSRSMSYTIGDARKAAAAFIERLGQNDQSAVLTFSHEVNLISSFSSNHAYVSEAVKQITHEQLKQGSCMYDATYEALEMTASGTPGRRGVIVFTDGKDEIIAGGAQCSIHTLDDVINFAQSEKTPVYVIGMGENINENEIKRLASTTGGTALISRDAAELDATFTKLYEQLNNEYILTYQSTRAYGPHSITLGFDYRNQKDQETYSFTLPMLPAMISFKSPAEGDSFGGKMPLIVRVQNEGPGIAGIEFASNGVVIGKDVTEPYEFEWDTTTTYPGETLLEAIALGKDGAELARSELKVTILEPTPTPEPTETPEPMPTSENTLTVTDETAIIPTEIPEELSPIQRLIKNEKFPLYAGIAAALLILLIIIIVLTVRNNKKNHSEELEDFKLNKSSDGDVTMDEIIMPQSMRPVALLTILTSDDRNSIGQQFSITKLPTILGRSAVDADILFTAKDQAVSRRHAKIEKQGHELVITDLQSKYGTFVNDLQIGSAPQVLKNGDVIRLGSRATLRFEKIADAGESDETMDGIDISGLNNEDTRAAF